MGLVDSLKDFYFKLEDKYYAFVDWLDKKHIPYYKFVDFVESRGIPSFPLSIALALLLAFFLLFAAPMLFGLMPEQKVLLSIEVSDEEREAVSSAIVRVSAENFSANALTSSTGIAKIEVPAGKELSLSVEKDGFKKYSRTISISEDSIKKISLEREKLSREILFKKSGSNELIEGELTAVFECSEEKAGFREEKTISQGRIKLDNIPSNCGTLSVKVQGYDKEKHVDITESMPEVFLEGKKTATGTVYVFVKDKENNKALSGMRVVLVGAAELSELTDESGSVMFKDVPVGDYYLKVMDTTEYQDITTQKKTLNENDSITFNIKMEKAAREKINIRVVDSTGTPVKNAGLKLYRKNESIAEYSGNTNESGEYTFNVPPQTLYDIVVDKPGFFKARAEVLPQEEFFEITLKEQTSQNGGAISVSVVDKKGKPVENAKVELKLSSGEFTGYEAITGLDGMAEFPSIEAGKYYVYCSKNGFDGVSSNDFTVKERELVNVSVTMVIGEGSISVKVLDSGQSVQNATVKAFDAFSGAKIGEKKTSSDGTALFSVRIDRKAFFVIEADGFLPFTSIPVVPVHNSTKEITAELMRETGKIETKMKLTLNGEEVRDFVSAGETYKALLQVVLPRSYEKAGLFVLTGNSEEGKTNSVEEDIVFIRSISTVGSIKTGSTFSPPMGSSADRTSTGSTKWAEIEFQPGKNHLPSKGVFNALVEIQIRDNAAMGEETKISYRGYGVNARYERDPIDAVLGNNASSPKKQGLYAKTYDRSFTVGQTNLCSEGYCSIVFIEDMETGLKSAVIDSFPANVSSQYALGLRINRSSAGTLKNAFLSIKNPEKGILFKNYKIFDATGRKIEGSANSSEFLKEIGNLSQDLTISASVEFETIKEGVNQIEISLSNESGNDFTKTVKVNVRAGEELKLEIVPKQVVPFIDNQLLFKVLTVDGEAIPNAFVRLSLNGNELVQGTTDSSGVFAFELEAPNAGSELKVEVKKNGYRTLKKTIKISEDIISIKPERVNFDLMVDERNFKQIDLELLNDTAVKLEIAGVSISDSLSGLVSIRGIEKLIGLELPLNESLPVQLTAKLTDKGKNLTETKILHGSIGFYLSNSKTGKTWFSKVPVRVRILLGGELDSLDCLLVEPVSWEIVSGGEEKKLSVKLKNACSADGKSVSLRDLEAGIDWGADNSVGSFFVSSSDLKAQEKELGTEFVLLAPELKGNFNGALLVSFSPNKTIKSADSMPAVVLRAKHNSFNGTESVEARISTTISLSNLSKCVKIEATEPLKIKTQPSNLGWALGSNYFYSSQPYQPYGFSTYPSGVGDYSMYGSAPQNFYGVNGWSSSSGSEAATQWSSNSSASFKLKNECNETIEISIDVPDGLSVDKESIELNPRKSSNVRVEAGVKSGSYSMGVNARTLSSKDDFEFIGSVDVQVVNLDELMQKCMPSIEPTVFKPNFFGIFKTKGTVFNRCYDYGFRLEMLSPQNFVCYSPQSNGEQKEQCPLIENFYAMPPHTVKVSENQTIEVMEFSFNLKEKIKEDFDDFDSAMELGKLGNIIVNNFSVTSPGVVFIPYRLPDSAMQSFAPRQVSFQVPYDFSKWWNWLSERKPKENLPPSAPELTIEPVKPLTENDIVCTAKAVDPEGDRLSYDINWLHNGRVIAHSKGSQNSLSLKSTLTRTGQEYECVAIACDKWDCSEKNHSTVKVLRPEGAETFAGFSPCTEDETGEKAFNDYGFNHLAFSWKEDDFGENSCVVSGSTGYYCDGVQFMLSLRHKIARVQETVKKINQFPEYARVLKNGFVPEPGNLFRFSKKQTTIKEEKTGREFLFFMKDNDSLLEPVKKDCSNASALKHTLEELISSTGNPTSSLEGIEAEFIECYGSDFGAENIVGITRSINDNEVWTELVGSDKAIFKQNMDLGAWVIAFNDFKELHKGLVSIALAPENEDGFSIQFSNFTTKKHSRGQWLDFVKKLYSGIEFKVGVINKNNLSDATKELVIGKATELNELADCSECIDNHTTAINSAFLISDNYSPNFVENFIDYGNYSFDLDSSELEFENYASFDESTSEFSNALGTEVQTGKYYFKVTPTVFIDGDRIKVKSYKIKLALDKGINELNENYAKNPFFYLPFDASEGLLASEESDVDYGVVFEKNSDKEIYYFYDSAQANGHAALKTVPENSVASGKTKMEINFVDGFPELQGSMESPGKVMEIDLENKAIKYLPSLPVGLELSWNDGLENTVFYRFDRKFDEFYGNAQKLFTWWIGEDKKETDSLGTYDGSNYEFCSEWVGQRKMAKVKMQEPGKWIALAFMPFERKAVDLPLELVCAEEETQIKAKTFDGRIGSTDKVKGISGGAVFINVSADNFKPPSFKFFVQGIKSSEVCVKPDNGKLVLWWNPQILEDLKP